MPVIYRWQFPVLVRERRYQALLRRGAPWFATPTSPYTTPDKPIVSIPAVALPAIRVADLPKSFSDWVPLTLPTGIRVADGSVVPAVRTENYGARGVLRGALTATSVLGANQMMATLPKYSPENPVSELVGTVTGMSVGSGMLTVGADGSLKLSSLLAVNATVTLTGINWELT